MTDPDQQRLQELQALTQSSLEAPRLSTLASMLPYSKLGRYADNQAEEEYEPEAPSGTFSAQPKQPQAPPESDAERPYLPGAPPPPSFPIATPGVASRDIQSSELAHRVQQTASTTLQLRDQREFKLSLEEDASRDDALVNRLAEQTVTIVQQRDEQLYQRVMQAIEQRLGQGRNAFL